MRSIHANRILCPSDVVHFRVCKQKNGHKLKETKQYIAYYLNQHYRESPEEQLITFFDMTDAVVSNMVCIWLQAKLFLKIMTSCVVYVQSHRSRNHVKRRHINVILHYITVYCGYNLTKFQINREQKHFMTHSSDMTPFLSVVPFASQSCLWYRLANHAKLKVGLM